MVLTVSTEGAFESATTGSEPPDWPPSPVIAAPLPRPPMASRWQSSRVLRSIGALAVRWSQDNPDLREDLFQEGCLAAWLTELHEPAAPPTHLVRSAEQRMLHVRHLGRSVDGRANAHHGRPRVYQVLRLDQPLGDADDAPFLHASIPSRQPNPEEEVLGYLHAVAFLATLGARDRCLLELRLAGYRWCEIAHLVRMSLRQVHAHRAALQKDAKRHWDPEQS